MKSKQGYYGAFGGCFMPESLMFPMNELIEAFSSAIKDETFKRSYFDILENYVGRPTPLTQVHRFSAAINGPTILLKREDLLHTGAHKINNAIGQCLLAKRMGKTRIVAETGAGQHGVATATACTYFGLECVVYMGSTDMQRQMPNVQRMQMLGAKIVPVDSGAKTLKDAVNEALRDYSEHYENTHYCLGSALGPHPYPEMVAFFQSIIGREARAQCFSRFGRLPNAVVACVGGGSNSIGIFNDFIEDNEVTLIGVEAGGVGNQLGEHAARILGGKVGVLHGYRSYFLQDDAGQIANTHSISAGLDYPGIGPQHAFLHESKRAEYTSVTDQEALSAFKSLIKTEGIIPALESSHALAYVMKHTSRFSKDDLVIINLSGRGDKDLPQLIERGNHV